MNNPICRRNFLGTVLAASLSPRLPEEEDAVSVIESFGGSVIKDERGRVFGASLPSGNFSDRELATLKSLPNLEDLHFSGTKITDAGLVHLKGISHLRNLDLGETLITDAGLAHLQGMAGRASLLSLGLQGTRISDDGLKSLQTFKGLSSLALSWTCVSRKGLEHLKGLTELRFLRLPVRALRHLNKEMTRLFYLGLSGTKLSDQGMLELRRLPCLEILDLSETEVDDRCLLELRHLRCLQKLILSASQISSKTVHCLKQLPALECLSVIGKCPKFRDELIRAMEERKVRTYWS